jgi:hypothetical protein
LISNNDPTKMTTTTKIHTTGKKQTPEDDVRTRLRAHIMAGGTPKEFALAEGWHPTTAGKMLEGMNIKKVFVTQEEQAMIVAMRKERAA